MLSDLERCGLVGADPLESREVIGEGRGAQARGNEGGDSAVVDPPGGAVQTRGGGEVHRRHLVALDAELHDKTAATARAVHKLLTSGQTPPPRKQPHCQSCSLMQICMPELMAAPHRAAQYLHSLWHEP